MKGKPQMGKQDFPRRERAKPAKGLLERAADIFNFSGALSGQNLPPLDIAPDLIPALPDTALAPQFGPKNTVPPAPRARDWNGPMQRLDHERMAQAGYLVPGASTSGLGEEFRIIKRELLSRIRGGPQRGAIPNGNIVLVTSAHPGDGKTFCAVNLALSLAAESDVEILLIDADFAKPSIPEMLGLSSDKGLLDALADSSLAIEDMVIRTDVPTLGILPAGGSSLRDAEYLASARAEAIISALVAGRPERIILFDSPPLLAASVGSILAAHAGQTLMVVRADRTTETALRDAAGLLNGCAHVELLLNGVKFSASGRRFGAYYGKED